jgi:hypothetical protein
MSSQVASRWPSLGAALLPRPRPGARCTALHRPSPPPPCPSRPGPARLTWRRRHGLQAGVGAAVVAAAPVPRALGVRLAAGGLAGAGGQRPRGRRAAVGARLPGAGGTTLLRLGRAERRSGAGPRPSRAPQPCAPAVRPSRAPRVPLLTLCFQNHPGRGHLGLNDAVFLCPKLSQTG